jgi:hypothetical protein
VVTSNATGSTIFLLTLVLGLGHDHDERAYLPLRDELLGQQRKSSS